MFDESSVVACNKQGYTHYTPVDYCVWPDGKIAYDFLLEKNTLYTDMYVNTIHTWVKSFRIHLLWTHSL